MVKLAVSCEAGVCLVLGVETWRGVLSSTLAKVRAEMPDINGCLAARKSLEVGFWQRRDNIVEWSWGLFVKCVLFFGVFSVYRSFPQMVCQRSM